MTIQTNKVLSGLRFGGNFRCPDFGYLVVGGDVEDWFLREVPVQSGVLIHQFWRVTERDVIRCQLDEDGSELKGVNMNVIACDELLGLV